MELNADVVPKLEFVVIPLELPSALSRADLPAIGCTDADVEVPARSHGFGGAGGEEAALATGRDAPVAPEAPADGVVVAISLAR